MIGAVLRRPRLWLTAVRQAMVLVPSGWWRRPPFLPIAPPEYVRFRQLTHTGSDVGGPGPDAVVSYLAWCRQWRIAARRVWQDAGS